MHLPQHEKAKAQCEQCKAVLNPGMEDEMHVTGYRRSRMRTCLCWLGICATAGLLRLILHWWQLWKLYATCVPCSLATAEKVLIEEHYQGKYKMYHIKKILELNCNDSSHTTSNIIPEHLHLSVNFTAAQFTTCKSLRVFRCKQLIYAWECQTQTFQKINGLDIEVPCSYFHQETGLSTVERLARQLVYGRNEITVRQRSYTTLFLLDVLNPLYVFQIFSVVLWYSYGYYYYATVVVLMFIFSVTASIRRTKQNEQHLAESVLNTGSALIVNAEGQAQETLTHELVPGDIIEIPSSGCNMSCDAVLLSGSCTLDESMLTGESVPVPKTPLPMEHAIIYDKREHAQHTLFCGTNVIQARQLGGTKVLACVINTGNLTTKGGLVRSILYPPPVDYKFETDSYKILKWLGLLGVAGFIYTIVSKTMRGIEPIKIIIESFDLLTIIVPPALPAAMTVGRMYAQQRLERDNIYCISPLCINVAGSIDCCCFDKTGTLTEDGLDLWGVVPKSTNNVFQAPLKQTAHLPMDNLLLGMVTCHSITNVNEQIKGDPLDLKMFESTGWILENDQQAGYNQKYEHNYNRLLRQPQQLVENCATTQLNAGHELGIVCEFPFTSSLQRMSVITNCMGQRNFNIYCKGSPEMLQHLCCPESLPHDYTQQLSTYARKGYRIIAMAYKDLTEISNYEQAQHLAREAVEKELEFLGFIIFENRLKPDTANVISTLAAAKIRTIMVTGDNILTALSVARECGIVRSTQRVITVHASKEKHDNAIDDSDNLRLNYTLELNDFDNMHNIANGTSQTSMENVKNANPNRDIELGVMPSQPNTFAYDINYAQNYCYAMDGNTWQMARDHFPKQMEKFLMRGVVFARMSPKQKQALIMELQSLDYSVAMCGDGANDCGALKTAHIGISLSESESSFAAPFTSRNPTIASVPSVIREGRAALVTSFGVFKYIVTYSLVSTIAVLTLYTIDSNFTDIQFLYVDLCLVTILTFFFCNTKAYDGALHEQMPLNSLISPTPLISLALHLIVVIVFQLVGWWQLMQQTWFVPFKYTSEENLGCYENYTIFSLSCFHFLSMAFVYSKGTPYRRPIWSNRPYCLWLIINICFVLVLVIVPNKWLANFFELIMPPDNGFRYFIMLYGIMSFLAHLIIESYIVEHLIFQKIQIKREQKMSTAKRKHIQLEYELRSKTD